MPPRSRYTLDLRFWQEDTEDFWYVVGFILGDGNISRSSYRIYWGSTDRQIVEDIRSVLGSSHPIRVDARPTALKRRKPVHYLIIKNRAAHARLVGLGIVPNKSRSRKYVVFPPVQHLYAFLRGFMDSDGSFSLRKNASITSNFLCSSSVQLEVIRVLLQNDGLLVSNVYPSGKQFRIELSTTSSVALLTRLYSGTSGLVLQRKRDKALCILDKKMRQKPSPRRRWVYPSDAGLQDMLSVGTVAAVARQLGLPYENLRQYLHRRSWFHCSNRGC